MSIAIYLHRNDLRLHDNATLQAAIEGHDELLPLFIFDPRHFERLPLGFRKADIKRFYFLRDCVRELRATYKSLGGNLMLRVGIPETLIAEVAQQTGAATVYLQAEVGSEETGVEKRMAEQLVALGIALHRIWDKTLYHRDDLPFAASNIPATSKSFRIRAQKEAGVRDLLPTPEQITVPSTELDWGLLPEPTEVGYVDEEQFDYVPPIAAGEVAAIKRLEYYTFETGLVERYKWTRNRSLGMDYSSKFSAWLSRGCLSPRQIYHTVKRYEKEVKRNISTWWLVFEVVWRDFFIFSHLKHGNAVFRAGGFKDREVDWQYDQALFRRWAEGKTGIPFVDAHLRELLKTGFVSNRGRVNTASFLSRDYEIDWRWGAAWFESHLLDHDVSSNWYNWNTQATEIYYTNPVHQSLKYDKQGAYILSQLPELKSLPRPFFHAPWLAQAYTEVEPVRAYPDPAFIQKKWGRSINNIKKEIPESFAPVELSTDEEEGK
jgi:deoxyribodipyrimidine photo-lyase